MPSPPEVLSHGATSFQAAADRPYRRARQIHRLEQTWCATAVDDFTIGEAPPNHANMRIVDIEPLDDFDGTSVQLRLRSEGILDSDTYLELRRQNLSPETGWDVTDLEIYTRDLTEARWGKGQRLQSDPLESITATASNDILSQGLHGLITGQLLSNFTFSSGFGGITSGGDYYVYKINADTFRLCRSRANAEVAGVSGLAAAINITGVAATNVITSVAHGLSNGDCGTFPVLNGGAGLTAITVPYYVLVIDADTFKVSLTPGGTEVNFTSAITSGSTFRRGTYIDITTDGSAGIATPIPYGHECMFITDRADRPADAQDYHHLDLQLKGLLLRQGDSKPIVRTWDTGSNRYTSRFDGLTILTGNVFQGFPPVYSGTDNSLSGTDIPVEYSMAQIRITDTMVTTTQPDPNWLYLFWEPENAPTVTLFSLSAESYTYQFPYGWVLDNMQVQQIPGKSVWLLSLTWTKRPAAIPTSA